MKQEFETTDSDWTKIPREALQVFFWQVAQVIANELERILRLDFVRSRPGPNGGPTNWGWPRWAACPQDWAARCGTSLRRPV